MATATWIRNLLEKKGVEYEESYHHEAFTAQSLAQKEHISGHHVAKVVVIIADKRPVELVLPASRHVALNRVRDMLGAKEVRLATEDELAIYFRDCERGAIPPLPHLEAVDVWMDESMRVPGDILFPAGTHCDAVRMHFDDWFGLVQPKVGNFSD
jgi:Ala-tRNA(Pro) deacylase